MTAFQPKPVGKEKVLPREGGDNMSKAQARLVSLRNFQRFKPVNGRLIEDEARLVGLKER